MTQVVVVSGAGVVDKPVGRAPGPALCAAPLAALLVAAGTADFGPALLAWLQRSLPVSRLAAFEMGVTGAAAWSLTAAADMAQAQELDAVMADYLAMGVPCDPFVRQALGSPSAQGLTLIRPERIRDSFVRERFYEVPRVGQEAICWQRSDQGLRALCLLRAQELGRFGRREAADLDGLAPLLLQLLEVHASRVARSQVAALARTSAQREQTLVQLAQALVRREADLTRREAQVCAHLALGFAPSAIALILAISEHTVTTHRKRAYAKLRVSSRTELFALCSQLAAGLPSQVLAGRGA